MSRHMSKSVPFRESCPNVHVQLRNGTYPTTPSRAASHKPSMSGESCLVTCLLGVSTLYPFFRSGFT